MPRTWDNLVTAILGLPGVGPKMAERIALHLVRHEEDAAGLTAVLTEARARMKRCPLCGDFIETDEAPRLCARCVDPLRDARVLCVVEDVPDVAALERSGAYRGRYHVLGGALSALDGIGPEELRIEPLLDRVRRDGADEVILATNPTVEGETTAAYLADLLKSMDVRVTRLAAGLPAGAVIQYADEHTLAQAVTGRRAVP
jgi:recombination protein RecR